MKLRPHLLLFLPLLLLSCNDKIKNPDAVPCTSCQSVREAKDFFYFKMGSWWVYEEESSHIRDSMYVTQASEDTNGYQFDIRIKSALTDYEYHYWPEYYGVSSGCSTTNAVSKKCLHVKRGKGKFQDNLGESSVLFVRFRKGDFVYTGSDLEFCPNNTITVAEIFSSYDHFGQMFEKTIQINTLCEYAEGKQPTKIFYSKNIGILRKELLDSNQVWNLVNYYIEE